MQKRLRLTLFGAVCAAGFGIGLAYDGSYLPDRPEVRVMSRPQTAAGAPLVLPSFEATAADGSTFKTDDYAGRIVVIELGRVSCGPCTEVLPQLADLMRKYQDDERAVIRAVYLDDSVNDVREHVTKYDVDPRKVAVVGDWNGRGKPVHGLFSRPSIPGTYLFAPDGRLYDTGHSASDIRPSLEKLLKE